MEVYRHTEPASKKTTRDTRENGSHSVIGCCRRSRDRVRTALGYFECLMPFHVEGDGNKESLLMASQRKWRGGVRWGAEWGGQEGRGEEKILVRRRGGKEEG